jgi:hypothetical protein
LGIIKTVEVPGGRVKQGSTDLLFESSASKG